MTPHLRKQPHRGMFKWYCYSSGNSCRTDMPYGSGYTPREAWVKMRNAVTCTSERSRLKPRMHWELEPAWMQHVPF